MDRADYGYWIWDDDFWGITSFSFTEMTYISGNCKLGWKRWRGILSLKDRNAFNGEATRDKINIGLCECALYS